MTGQIAGVRGVAPLLPTDAVRWRAVEDGLRTLMDAYGFREIRLPILERTELYARAVGEVTDIVEKEMYTFTDRSGDSLSLRPEGTAGCVRAGIEGGLFHNQAQRLWYQGPMFRHERPQKGRYRQFHQWGVEAYGMAGPAIEAEVIALGARVLAQLGVKARLLVNSLGTRECRERYREALVHYLAAHRDRLDDDSLRRLERNPLRVLDSKNPDMAALLAEAPTIADYWSAESRSHFVALQDYLTALGVAFEVAPRLVRGLDYYTHTVFEWTPHETLAQATVIAGGRYDGLVSELGGAPTSAVGFAIGMERLVALVTRLPAPPVLDVFIMTNVSCQLRALVLAEGLRDAGLTVETHLAGASAKSQMKRARDCGARVIVEAQDEARVAIVQAGAAKGEGIVTWAEAVARISQIVGAKAKIDGE
ncbi:histidine--tRNA ligase [Acidiferrobacter thiooxydans]|uniref:Histidine--tRNA ligase n=1 Tax=Acidiferrobacter thiooxydans TaxID=163359 RepID=A0A1C2FYX4_9GAMM|nr:histidine--tRNA ligase [Acidiferrobacter thiooxydans]MDA8190482.1 histidine--tRNA ligase [Gammaproteobacteria bacterium]RCN59154.1 histidine--tRNA ligase [Acidiferrobacter thiooxydans]UEO00879.1 histidine--tRNA ligase [Acidiferrobacter thiooxydans]